MHRGQPGHGQAAPSRAGIFLFYFLNVGFVAFRCGWDPSEDTPGMLPALPGLVFLDQVLPAGAEATSDLL